MHVDVHDVHVLVTQEQKRLEMEKLQKDLEEMGIQPGAHLAGLSLGILPILYFLAAAILS